MNIDIEEIDRRIARASGISLEGENWLKDMMGSYVKGIPLPEGLDEAVWFIGDADRLGTFVQLLFIKYLAERDPDIAEKALKEMKQLRYLEFQASIRRNSAPAQTGDEELMVEINEASRDVGA